MRSVELFQVSLYCSLVQSQIVKLIVFTSGLVPFLFKPYWYRIANKQNLIIYGLTFWIVTKLWGALCVLVWWGGGFLIGWLSTQRIIVSKCYGFNLSKTFYPSGVKTFQIFLEGSRSISMKDRQWDWGVLTSLSLRQREDSPWDRHIWRRGRGRV